MSPAEHVTAVDVTAALRHALEGKEPVRRALLPAVLRGMRVRVDDALLDRVLAAGPFVQVADGRWTLGEVTPPPPGPARPASSVAPPPVPHLELDKSELLGTLDLTPTVLTTVLRQLDRSDSTVAWGELARRLDRGSSVRVSQATLRKISAAARYARAEEQSARRRQVEEGAAAAAVSRQREEAERLRREVDERDRENVRLKAALETKRITERSAAVSAPQPSVHEPRSGWRTLGGVLCYQAAPAETAGERELATALESLPAGLVLTGLSLVHGRQEREVDALVLHPRGAFTIEQKDTRRSGTVEVLPNTSVTVGGVPIENAPLMRAQARKQSQLLAAIAGDHPELTVGFVRSLLSFAGPVHVPVPPEGALDGGDVLATTPRCACALIEMLAHRSTTRLSAEDVSRLLQRMHVDVPARGGLQKAGFAGTA